MRIPKPTFLDSVFLVILSLYIVAGTGDVPFHGDESTQIYMGRDYYIQFVQGDYAQIRYSPTPQLPADQDLRLYNGTLPKYIFGAITHSMGYTLETWTVPYDWGADYAYNETYGHLPEPENLYRTRLGSVVGLIVGLWSLFALGRLIGGRGVAYLATLYYALNPVILMNGRRAMMEGYLTGFSILVVLLCVWIFQRYRQHEKAEQVRFSLQDWAWYILWGIVSGLCLASKHTGLFTLAALFFASGLWTILVWVRTQRGTPARRLSITHLWGSIGAGVASMATFYVLNPSWWGVDPFFLVKLIYDLRADLLSIQVQIFGGYASFADKLRGFLDFVFVATPQYYEVSDWQIHIGDQIARYETSPFRGVSLGGTVFGGIILGILVIIGMVAFFRQPHNLEMKWVIGWWALAMVGLTLVLTPLEWQRYYLPIYPLIGIFGALGIVSLVRYGHHQWQKRQTTATPIPSVAS